MSYVYVIATAGNHQVKIGYSKDPQTRLKTLQTGNHETLVLHHVEEMTGLTPKLFETIVHRYLRHKRIHGEWFLMSPDEAKEMIEWVAIRWSDHPNPKLALKMGML